MFDDSFEQRLYLWSFSVRIFLGLAGWFLTRYVDIPLMQDALFYEEVAVAVANDWLTGESNAWLDAAMRDGRQPWLIVGLLAACYYLFSGASATPVAIGICSLITACAPVFTYQISTRIGAPRGGARAAGWLVALSPAFAFWSGALYKEGFILVALTLSVKHILLLQESWRPRSFVILILCLVAFFGLRFYLAMIMGLVLVLGLLLGRTR